MAVNRLIVDRLKGEVDEIPARDLPGASRNLSVGAAVETEKAQLLNDQPTAINKLRSASDVLRQLKNRAPGLFVEGTVESEEDVEPALTAERDEQ